MNALEMELWIRLTVRQKENRKDKKENTPLCLRLQKIAVFFDELGKDRLQKNICGKALHEQYRRTVQPSFVFILCNWHSSNSVS